MNKALIFCLLLTFINLSVKSQSSAIEGTIKDADKQTPVPGATVSIFQKNDTSAIALKTTLTDS